MPLSADKHVSMGVRQPQISTYLINPVFSLVFSKTLIKKRSSSLVRLTIFIHVVSCQYNGIHLPEELHLCSTVPGPFTPPSSSLWLSKYFIDTQIFYEIICYTMFQKCWYRDIFIDIWHFFITCSPLSSKLTFWFPPVWKSHGNFKCFW